MPPERSRNVSSKQNVSDFDKGCDSHPPGEAISSSTRPRFDWLSNYSIDGPEDSPRRLVEKLRKAPSQGRIVAYRSIAAHVGRDPMTVRRMWNRWDQDDNTECRAGS
ncbi:hypothetical protein TNCV_5033821 [Trichonephila clavipes]|nr:hypothetical protein TNCV_5033821 [Trichonephila clavipes]